MSGEAAGEEKGRHPLDVLADVLGFFAAARRYSYVDIVGNALDPLTAAEALRDALRDFDTECHGPGRGEEEVKCPSISPEDLARAGDYISRVLLTAKPQEFFRITRELSMKALSRAALFRRKGSES